MFSECFTWEKTGEVFCLLHATTTEIIETGGTVRDPVTMETVTESVDGGTTMILKYGKLGLRQTSHHLSM